MQIFTDFLGPVNSQSGSCSTPECESWESKYTNNTFRLVLFVCSPFLLLTASQCRIKQPIFDSVGIQSHQKREKTKTDFYLMQIVQFVIKIMQIVIKIMQQFIRLFIVEFGSESN